MFFDKMNYERSKLGSAILVLDSIFLAEVLNHNMNLAYMGDGCGTIIKNGVSYDHTMMYCGHSEFDSNNDSIKTYKFLLDRYPGSMSKEIMTVFDIDPKMLNSYDYIVNRIYENFFKSKKGHKECMLGLDENGDIIKKDAHIYTSVSVYCYPVKRNGEIVEYAISATVVFFDNHNKSTKLKYYKNDTLDNEISVTKRTNSKMTITSSGHTRLIMSAINGDINTMKDLLNKGADVNVVDNMGRNALYWSILKGNYEAVELLLKHNSNIILCDNYKQKPKNIDEKIIFLLNEYGYSFNKE